MNISLKPITEKNYQSVCNLEIPDEQQNHLSHNRSSLLEYFADSNSLCPRAIYREDEVVGFIMWALESQTEVWIFRFMVAFNHQKKGVGRTALLIALEEIKSDSKIKEIGICYHPENTVSRSLYISLGFRETGMDENDEDMLATIKV